MSEENDDAIEYDPDEQYFEQDDGLNFEDNFIEAEHSPNPIEAYKQIIELEISNSNECKWSFKSYEKLCQLYIMAKNFEEFTKSLDKLFELYPKIDDLHKQDTIRNISYTVSEIKDFDFVEKVFNTTMDQLKNLDIGRAYVEISLRYSKILFKLNKYDHLRKLLPEIINYLGELQDDDLYKSIKLEFIVMQIDLCRRDNEKKKIIKLYKQAEKLMKDQIFDDKVLSAIINEEGGKIDLIQKDFDKALQKFKIAFHNYKENGSLNAINLLKYAFLASLITTNRSIIVSPEEAKFYKNDKSLNCIVELFEAFENMDVGKLNNIWDQIIKNEKDEFIQENKEEILYHIRLNYIINKLKAYRVCKFETLEKELGVDSNYITSIILHICKEKYVNAKLNLSDKCLEIDNGENIKSYEGFVANYNQWLAQF